jgi:VIT1/CCC1 family predicted Fe2+/Mn2+ transporter
MDGRRGLVSVVFHRLHLARASFRCARGTTAICLCIGLSSIGLAAIGMFTSLFNGRSALFSTFKQIVIGMIAARFTFAIGKVLGISLS